MLTQCGDRHKICCWLYRIKLLLEKLGFASTIDVAKFNFEATTWAVLWAG
jgi:hypothetical protein